MSCQQLTDKVFDKCCRACRLDPDAEERVRDYISSHLCAIKRGDAVVARLIDNRLLAEMHMSGEDEKHLLKKINDELKRIEKSGIHF